MYTKKAAKCLLLMFLFVSILSIASVAYAEEKPTDWLNKGASGATTVNNTNTKLSTIGVSVHTLVKTGLNIIGFIVLGIYGGKWWTAGSDSSKKKELKEQAINYVIGSVIFFGASFLYSLLFTLANGFQ